MEDDESIVYELFEQAKMNNDFDQSCLFTFSDHLSFWRQWWMLAIMHLSQMLIEEDDETTDAAASLLLLAMKPIGLKAQRPLAFWKDIPDAIWQQSHLTKLFLEPMIGSTVKRFGRNVFDLAYHFKEPGDVNAQYRFVIGKVLLFATMDLESCRDYAKEIQLTVRRLWSSDLSFVSHSYNWTDDDEMDATMRALNETALWSRQGLMALMSSNELSVVPWSRDWFQQKFNAYFNALIQSYSLPWQCLLQALEMSRSQGLLLHYEQEIVLWLHHVARRQPQRHCYDAITGLWFPLLSYSRLCFLISFQDKEMSLLGQIDVDGIIAHLLDCYHFESDNSILLLCQALGPLKSMKESAPFLQRYRSLLRLISKQIHALNDEMRSWLKEHVGKVIETSFVPILKLSRHEAINYLPVEEDCFRLIMNSVALLEFQWQWLVLRL